MKFFHMNVFMEIFFSSFDRIFRLTKSIIDDFSFRAYGKMGNAFSRAFLEFRQQIKKIGLYSNFQNNTKNEKEGHFPSGHKYVTN